MINEQINEEYKIWIVIREDLKMPPGKIAVQAAHSVQLLAVKVFKENPELYEKYTKDQSVVKVAVKAESEEHLLKLRDECELNKIPSQLIIDSGRTVFDKPTMTVLAFGPCLRRELSSKLKRLQLYTEK